MKIGSIDILKAYLGALELTSSNAFIGTVPVIENGPEPVSYPGLKFTSTGNSTVALAQNGSAPTVDLKYSLNGGKTWTQWDFSAISLTNGQTVCFKGLNTTFATGTSDYNNFVMTGSIAASGNIMSIIDDGACTTTTIPDNYCFCGMFNGCDSLTTAPALPATTLKERCYGVMFKGCASLTNAPELQATTLSNFCYSGMFENCTSLTTAPALPATTLANYCYSGMFNGCTSLTTAPELPATTLRNYCYNVMFQNCTALTTAPALPATTLKDSCYKYMFNGCTSLTTAPELTATTLAQYCYNAMFSNCTALTTAPELPATTLADHCYNSMFQNCTALTTAPALPATTLNQYCYKSMFAGCTALTTAPALPATTLADYCYNSMFKNCTELTTAPELPATTLIRSCYGGMFSGCTKLNYIKCLATDISAANCTSNWVSGVAATGTFERDVTNNSWTTGVNGIPTGWCANSSFGGLKFTAAADNSFVKMNVGGTWTPDMKYSLDGINWTSWDYTQIDIPNGHWIYMKGNNPDGFNQSDTNYRYFGMGGRIKASGSIMSLIDDGDGTLLTIPTTNYYCFSYLFSGCGALLTVPDLPATSVYTRCYNNMFRNCTRLTTIPYDLLPAYETPAASSCAGAYYGMFQGCTALTNSCNINYTVSNSGVQFANMFYGCTSLTDVGSIAITSFTGGTRNMEQMFYGCTSLTKAPELLATKLVNGCYSGMFNGCTKLNYIKCLATDISAPDCTTNWVNGVAATGTFVKAASMTGWTTDANGIPSGWIIENEGFVGLKFTSTGNSTIAMSKNGAVPKADLKYSLDDGKTWKQWDFSKISLSDGQSVCFKGRNTTFATAKNAYNAFNTTGSIAASGNIMSIIDDGACTTTTITANYCFYKLFSNCASLTTAPELPATTLTEFCYYHMFNRCSSLKYIKCLATDISAPNCTSNWVYDVASGGTFVKAASMTGWVKGSEGIPSTWTVEDAA